MKNKEKLLFVTNIPAPYRVDYFNLLSNDFDITVLYEREAAVSRDKHWASEQKREFNEFYLNSFKYGEEYSVSFDFIKYFRKYEGKIIVCGYGSWTTRLVIIYLWLMKRKFCLCVDGGLSKKEGKLKYLIKKFFINKADLYLTTGNETNKFLVHYGADPSRCYIYPFGSLKNSEIQCIDYSIENKIVQKKTYRDRKKIILFVGQFIYRKGIDILLNADRIINNDMVDIYIIGGVPTREYIDMVEEYKLKNVFFINFKTKQQLLEFYKISDVFVLPTREDIWGLSIIEAMSFGLPIITTYNCVAGKELINNGYNGFLVKSDDYEELATAINNIIYNESLQICMGNRNMQIASKYTIDEMARVSGEIFHKWYLT